MRPRASAWRCAAPVLSSRAVNGVPVNALDGETARAEVASAGAARVSHAGISIAVSAAAAGETARAAVGVLYQRRTAPAPCSAGPSTASSQSASQTKSYQQLLGLPLSPWAPPTMRCSAVRVIAT